LATVGVALTLIITSSVDALHGALLIVQRKVDEAPMVRPVTPEVGLDEAVTTAVPLTTDHAPVPTPAVLPARVAVVMLQSDWSAPAAAAVGFRLKVTSTSSVEAVHGALLIVQRRV
jgi:hypothetical protein